MNKNYINCVDCKHHLFLITKNAKCLLSKTDLGHAVIYNNCSLERSMNGSCCINAAKFEEAE